MKRSIVSVAVGLIAVFITTIAWGFDVGRTKTEAEIVALSPTTTAIQLNFKTELSDGIADLSRDDVVASWDQVGGIQPQPFKVFIPAGCFVANDRGFSVRDFRACGVELTVELGGRTILLSILEFEASLRPRRNGSAQLKVETLFTDNGQEPAILSTLGGAKVSIGVGELMGTAFPNDVETKGGISPQPF